jgi:hypothetical protein
VGGRKEDRREREEGVDEDGGKRGVKGCFDDIV